MTCQTEGGQMETLEKHIGANIKALRGGMTMQAFGQALRPYLGREWSRQAVWDAENGRRSFTAVELLALAQVLEVTVPQLFESSASLRWPSGRPLEPEEIDGLVLPDRYPRLSQTQKLWLALQPDWWASMATQRREHR